MTRLFKHTIVFLLIICVAVRFVSVQSQPAEWTEVLQTHLHKNIRADGIISNLFDYPKLRTETKNKFLKYISQLDNWNMTSCSTGEKTALLLNAYNAFSVYLIASNPCKVSFGKYCFPVKRITDIGNFKEGFFDIKVSKIGGKLYSLHDIEKELTELNDDPIIFFGICNGALSAPDLLDRAFTGTDYQKQLQDHLSLLLSNPTKGFRIEESSANVFLSPIFLQYKDKFDNFMKKTNQTFVDYLIVNSQSKIVQNYLLEHQSELILKYFSYNWRINTIH